MGAPGADARRAGDPRSSREAAVDSAGPDAGHEACCIPETPSDANGQRFPRRRRYREGVPGHRRDSVPPLRPSSDGLSPAKRRRPGPPPEADPGGAADDARRIPSDFDGDGWGRSPDGG